MALRIVHVGRPREVLAEGVVHRVAALWLDRRLRRRLQVLRDVRGDDVVSRTLDHVQARAAGEARRPIVTVIGAAELVFPRRARVVAGPVRGGAARGVIGPLVAEADGTPGLRACAQLAAGAAPAGGVALAGEEGGRRALRRLEGYAGIAAVGLVVGGGVGERRHHRHTRGIRALRVRPDFGGEAICVALGVRRRIPRAQRGPRPRARLGPAPRRHRCGRRLEAAALHRAMGLVRRDSDRGEQYRRGGLGRTPGRMARVGCSL
mmetsp:Transcript_21474/g.61326  ORF Transcript_21474/g.61326 Transcript_21474/m.61326 type:complete len:263 (-) Transcript_21474:100-888(-)